MTDITATIDMSQFQSQSGVAEVYSNYITANSYCFLSATYVSKSEFSVSFFFFFFFFVISLHIFRLLHIH